MWAGKRGNRQMQVQASSSISGELTMLVVVLPKKNPNPETKKNNKKPSPYKTFKGMQEYTATEMVEGSRCCLL